MRVWMMVIVAATLAACSGQKNEMSAELRQDLELVSSASALELASGSTSGAAVVSPVEQVARRTPAPAPTARARQPQRTTTAPQTRVAPAVEVHQEMEVAAAEPAPLPQPTENRGFDGMGETAVAVSGPAAGSGSGSTARGGGSGLGTILAGVGIAVIRGGVVVGDVHCPPPGRRPRGGSVLVLPNRSPSGGVTMSTTIRGITVGR